MTNAVERILPTDMIITSRCLRKVFLKTIPVTITVDVNPLKTSLGGVEIFHYHSDIVGPTPILMQQSQEQNGGIGCPVKRCENSLAQNRCFTKPNFVENLARLLFSVEVN